MIRVHRANNHVEFKSEYQDGPALREIVLRIARIFHPVRGEEVQLEVIAGRTIKIRGRDGKRYDMRKGKLDLTPDIADQMVCAITGKPYVPAPIRGTSVGLNATLNTYAPHEYDTLDEPTRRRMVDAFNAGRDYERSLKT